MGILLKIVIAFNYQNGTKTVTFAELEASGILSELAENGDWSLSLRTERALQSEAKMSKTAPDFPLKI